MRSKNSAPITASESRHLGRVKSLACSVCDTPGPVEAHHIKQGCHFTAVAVCPDCHRGSFAGWHGQKRAWIARKLGEIDALNITLQRLAA
jgi:hypothetical protein